ncbi:hypothetical protein [Xanthomonas sp. 3058]|uniref:hypothetical protein n=1 Tax=Xanthomonas sp. 3058 TaxID=3035314 RepID=UPI001608F8E5|nr:hypothetical protein [Xanthomonas sp. 3058]MBB5865921.1 hypothetical protein [Xanthomonas sp. 3058]
MKSSDNSDASEKQHRPVGRPPRGEVAMSAAERSADYRARKARRLRVGHAAPRQLSDGLLLDLIRKSIDNGSAAQTVARLVAELSSRYPINNSDASDK